MFVALIAAVIFTVFLTGYLSMRRECNMTELALRASERTVVMIEAVQLLNSGKGEIYRNQTSLPGKFWFVPNQDESDRRSFWQFVNDEGKMIEPLSKQSEMELNALVQIRVLVEPFED